MKSADVVIVGGGVAGLLAAWKLVSEGVKVTVLEAGPRLDRARAMEHFRQAVAKTPDAPYPAASHAPFPSVLSLKEGYYVQKGPDIFGSTYVRYLGGTTLHWLGSTMRFLPNDFRLASLHGVGVDWPISYGDLEPWYRRAEEEMGVSGDNADDLGSPRHSGYPLPPIRQSYLDTKVAAAIAPLSYRVRSTPQARNSVEHDGRRPCCGNSICVPICPIQAKYDATVHAAKIEKAGGYIVESAVAHKVEVGPDGRITGIRFLRHDHTEDRIEGRVYVIAAHAIETPKLLLHSRTDVLPNGVANSSGEMGRNLMDHPVRLSWALVKEPLYPYRGPLETSGIEEFRDGDFRGKWGAFRIPIGNDGWTWPGGDPATIATALIDQGVMGEELRRQVDDRISRQLRLASLTEQLPDPENRIVPSNDLIDTLGIPRPEIHYRLDEYTSRALEESYKVQMEVFKALDAVETHTDKGFYGAGHIMGTYRMGTDPKTSVVDPDLRSHDHPNLFLLGSGVFPTGGTANPTLTIAALSLRAAEKITGELKRSVL